MSEAEDMMNEVHRLEQVALGMGKGPFLTLTVWRDKFTSTIHGMANGKISATGTDWRLVLADIDKQLFDHATREPDAVTLARTLGVEVSA
jgi:hypothetical protein